MSRRSLRARGYRIDHSMKRRLAQPRVHGLEHLEPRVMLSATEAQMAMALDLPAGVVVTYTGDADAVERAVRGSYSRVLGFPSGPDEDFLMLSTGLASDIISANSSGSQGTDLGAGGESGDTATLHFTLTVPSSSYRQRLKFDFMFLSEEYPEYVGSAYNDFFRATVNGQNIALDEQANEVSVNNVFFGAESTEPTMFDGRTALLTASYVVPEDVTTLEVELSLGDVGDGRYDSAVLLDNVRFQTPQVVYLDFDGGAVGPHFGPQTDATLPAFSPDDVNSSDAVGDITPLIVNSVAALYDDYDIVFTTQPPDSGDYMTVVIGGDNDVPVTITNTLLINQLGTSTPSYIQYMRALYGWIDTIYGQAQSVDLGNVDRSDLAVVFSGEFDDSYGNESSHTILQRLVGTIAHEIGHNLGLRHVLNLYDSELMKKNSPRSPTAIFHDTQYNLAEYPWPDGSTQQNSVAYLNGILGNGYTVLAPSTNFSGHNQSIVINPAKLKITGGVIAIYSGGSDADSDNADVDTSPLVVPITGPGPVVVTLPAGFENPMLGIYGSSKAGGSTNIFSGQPQDGDLDFADTLVPLLDDEGEFVDEIPLAVGAPGKLKALTASIQQTPYDAPLLPGGKGTFVDSDGDVVSVKLSGGGFISVIEQEGGGISRILLQQTTARSALSVSVKKASNGDGRVDVGQIVGTTLKAIKAPAASLSGEGIDLSGWVGSIALRDVRNGADIHLGGLSTQSTKVTLHEVQDDTQIQIASAISNFTAARVGAGSIAAPSVGVMSIRGDAAADLSGDLASDVTLDDEAAVQSLKSLSVTGRIAGATLRLVNSAGLIRAGILEDSSIYVGLDALVTGLPQDSFEFVNQEATLAQLQITGLPGEDFAIVNSHVAAWTLGSLSLGLARSDNGGDAFGFAGHTVNAVRYVTAAGTLTANDMAGFSEIFGDDDATVLAV